MALVGFPRQWILESLVKTAVTCGAKRKFRGPLPSIRFRIVLGMRRHFCIDVSAHVAWSRIIGMRAAGKDLMHRAQLLLSLLRRVSVVEVHFGHLSVDDA